MVITLMRRKTSSFSNWLCKKSEHRIVIIFDNSICHDIHHIATLDEASKSFGQKPKAKTKENEHKKFKLYLIVSQIELSRFYETQTDSLENSNFLRRVSSPWFRFIQYFEITFGFNFKMKWFSCQHWKIGTWIRWLESPEHDFSY